MFSMTNFPDLHASLRKNLSGPHSKSVLSTLTSKPAQRLSSSSTSSEEGHPVIGGILKDGEYSWLARGSMFTVLSAQNNQLQSVFDFNKAFSSLQYNVTTCTACEKLLLVGLSGADGRGLVAVFNPLISRLVKAIDVPYPVTALELVASQGGAVASSHCLSKNLRWLFGIVAVGTEEGHLYLLDLRFDSNSESPESIPSQIEIVPPVLRDVPTTREAIIEEGSYLAFELQAACHEEGVFHYAMPDDQIIESFYPSETSVTTMLYEPRVACLFVGFSFGQFQIFNLQDMSLIYSSEMQENIAPVLRFSFQEPENDPRNFCYLWVARGRNHSANTEEGTSAPLIMTMFQLVFMKKEVIPRSRHSSSTKDKENQITSQCRVLYKNFEICSARFEHSLGSGLVSSISQCCGSTLLLCSSIEKYGSEFEHHEPAEDDIDYGLSPASSLCVFAWQSPSYRGERREKLNVIVFDINRWYMAHMPYNFRDDDEDYIYSAVWTFHGPKDSFKADEVILGMHVPASKIQHFTSGMKPHPERFLLPSACSFTCRFVTDQSCYQYSMFGQQQQVLNTAAEQKSMCLVNPKEMHSSMLASELLPRHNVKQACTPDMMRENILSTALEHGQISFLLMVVRDLASGHLAACGVTLRFVMDWAWKSVANVKDQIDKLSVPIFDCSCAVLDSLVQSQLYFHMTQIHHLKIVFQKLMEYTEDSSEQSKEEMKTKLTVVTLIHQYLKVTQWFISNGLLPEQLDNNVDSDDDIMSPEGILIYKYARLRQVFDQRRAEISRSDTPDLLLIDGWVEEIGEQLTSRWLKEEGGKANYPPPSFMTLLDMYYLDCVDVMTKHCLVMYLLLDVLAMFSTLEDEEKHMLHESLKDRLTSIGAFLHVFSVPLGLIKLTKGFWLLDHKNFEESLNVFLDADTSPPLCSWQERRILRSFLYQGHPTMAMKYISTRRPKVETIQDAKMHMTIYIKSREPLKAWDLVQLSSGHHNMNELFLHLFTLCQQHSQLDQLLKLPFSPVEEDMVIKYLRESNSAEAIQILVLFHLQHSRYVDAIKLHSQNKHIRLMRDQSDESRRRNAKLDHIVQSYTNLLPTIEKEVTFSSHKLFKQSTLVRREVHKPSSLSAVVHTQLMTAPLSQADRLTKLMDKIDETRKNFRPSPMTPFRRKPQPSILGDYPTMDNSALTEKKSGVMGDIFVYPSIPSSRKSFPANTVYRRRSSFGGSPARGFNDNMDLNKPAHTHAPLSRIAHNQARDRRYSSISVASMLLQTPPITRKRPSVSQMEEGSLDAATPHSILKVKRLFDRNQSPSLSAISQNTSVFSCTNVPHTTTTGSNISLASESIVSGSSDQIRREMPTISTPSAKMFPRQGLKKYESTTDVSQQIKEQPLPLETPKKLRFAGLDNSVNDSVPQTPPVEQIAGLPNLTPIVVRAEDSQDDDEMDVDVTGEGSAKMEESEDSDKELPSEICEVSAIPVEAPQTEREIQQEDVTEEKSSLSDLENISDDMGDGSESFEVKSDLENEKIEVIEEARDRSPSPLPPQEVDEVICLDSSSSEDNLSEDIEQQEEEEDNVLQTQGELKDFIEYQEPPQQEDLRLVLSSSEESSGSEKQEEPQEEFHEQKDSNEEVASTNEETENEIKLSSNLLDTDKIAEDDQEDEDDIVIQSVVSLPTVLHGDAVLAEDAKYSETYEIEDEVDIEKERISTDLEQAHPVVQESTSFDDEVVESQEAESISPELFVPYLTYSPENEEEVKVEHETDDNVQGAESDMNPAVPDTEVPVQENEEENEIASQREDADEIGKLQLSLDSEELSEEIPQTEEKTLDSEEMEIAGKSEDIEIIVAEDTASKVEVVLTIDTAPKEEEVISESKSDEVDSQIPQQEEGVSEEESKPEELPEPLESQETNEEKPIELVKSDETEQVIGLTEDTELIETESEVQTTEFSQTRTDKDQTVKVLVEEKPSTPLPAKVLVEEKPSTPVVERVRSEPVFVLSPPTTRRLTRKSTRNSQVSPKAKPLEEKVPKSPSRVTRSASKQLKEPEFLFSPPTTRKRVSQRKMSQTMNETDQSVAVSPPRSTRKSRRKLQVPGDESDQSSVATSPVRSSKRRTRSTLQVPEPESDHSSVNTSPTRVSKRKTRDNLQVPDQESDQSSVTTPPVRVSKRKTRSASAKKRESSPEERADMAPATPSRRTRQSPARKPPSTPTRSSSRVKAKLQMTKESESESQVPEEPPVAKRSRRKKTADKSDVASSGTDSEVPSTPVRRSLRSKSKSSAWSPSQDKTRLIELTPLPEEEEEEVTTKKRKQEEKKKKQPSTSTRTTRSSTNNPIRMRRKAKVFTLDQ